MRRDYFTLDVRGVEWVDDDSEPERPAIVIDFEGPASILHNRIAGFSEELPDESAVDVSFRFQTSVEDSDAQGVVSVTDRMTGDYILELNTAAGDVLGFIRSAREFGKRSDDEEHRYRIELRIDGEAVATYEKRTFLIYNYEGNLLRKYSLIPSGVEL